MVSEAVVISRGMRWVACVVVLLWTVLSLLRLGWELDFFWDFEDTEEVRVPIEDDDGVVERLPESLKTLSPRDRKLSFVGIIMPSVLHALEKVIRTRGFLLELSEEGVKLGTEEERRISGLCRTYRVKTRDCTVSRLLLHVDVLPVSLVLAQAAVESGWGISRFAQEGNSLFGQWTVAQYKGLVPLERESGKTHRVRQFETIEASVDSYLRNVNGHPVYAGLRKERARYRMEEGTKNGYFSSELVWNLLPHLESYSQKGVEYLELLKSVIKGNGFESFDEEVRREKGYL